MGTRGLYGFRFNGQEKFTYNHFDSYPGYLGSNMAEFCESTPVEQMKDIFQRIILVKEDSKPTPEQIEACRAFTNLGVSTGSENDWYCLLRELQGEPDKLKEIPGDIAMIDNQSFIKDSLFCEYAYIVDLNKEVLEFWIGFQHEPWEENPYGQECDDGYYPCKKYAEFPLGSDSEKVVERMQYIDEHRDELGDPVNLKDAITDAAEELGWTVRFTDWNGVEWICLSNLSPEDEDLCLEYPFDEELPNKLIQEYEYFDVDEHVYECLEAKIRGGQGGIPGARALVEDAEAIQSMYEDLAIAIKKLY